MTTAENITRQQIAALSREAIEAGDYKQVAICDLAAMGDDGARAECARVIAYAEMRAAEDDE